jgi:choline dehydrogenase-like flavoprotein
VWQNIVATVEENAADVIATLGFSVGGDFHQYAARKLDEVAKAIDGAGFATLTAQFMPLSKRNFSYLLRGLKRSAVEPRLFLNAICNRWRLGRESGAGAVIDEVGAVSANGHTVTVKAKDVVIAAGTIESTRLLLELKAANAEVAATDALGRCLADHLSCPVGGVRPEDYTAIAARFRPRFSGPCLRTFRFVEKHPPAGWPRCFSHFIFDMDNHAFVVAKEAIAALQGKRLPRLKVGQVIGAIGGLVAFGSARYLRSSLYVPSGSAVHLQLDVEQVPDPSNRITLTAERDVHGRPRACVHWQISDQDRTNIRRAAQRILGAWPGPSKGIPELVPIPLEGDASKPYDAYHPVGTCRMGDDARAVVDFDLRVKGVANLFVLSTAVLPSAGTANPTFTLLCLGVALANRLSKDAGRRGCA